MSAASPKFPDTAKDSAAGEPSMEDILASIRRIIADDNAPEAEPEPAPPPAKPRLDDVLDLAQVAKPVRRPQPVAFDPPEIDFDVAEVDFSMPEAEPQPVAPPPPPPQRSAPERLQAAVEEQVVEIVLNKPTRLECQTRLEPPT